MDVTEESILEYGLRIHPRRGYRNVRPQRNAGHIHFRMRHAFLAEMVESDRGAPHDGGHQYEYRCLPAHDFGSRMKLLQHQRFGACPERPREQITQTGRTFGGRLSPRDLGTERYC